MVIGWILNKADLISIKRLKIADSIMSIKVEYNAVAEIGHNHFIVGMFVQGPHS